jgi:hypothetical protein
LNKHKYRPSRDQVNKNNYKHGTKTLYNTDGTLLLEVLFVYKKKSSSYSGTCTTSNVRRYFKEMCRYAFECACETFRYYNRVPSGTYYSAEVLDYNIIYWEKTSSLRGSRTSVRDISNNTDGLIVYKEKPVVKKKKVIRVKRGESIISKKKKQKKNVVEVKRLAKKKKVLVVKRGESIISKKKEQLGK